MASTPGLREVARAAGVSLTTASRAINHSKDAERISAEKAAHVRAIAEKIGYVGGYHRRSLRTGKAETLGVALEYNAPIPANQPIPHSVLKDFYFNNMIAGVERTTHATGYNLAMIVPGFNERAMIRGVKQVREVRLDGLVLLPADSGSENTVVLRESPDLAIVAILPAVPTQLPSVVFDGPLTIRPIIDHLQNLGHRRILYFGPISHSRSVPHRAMRDQYFTNEVKKRGLIGEICPLPSDWSGKTNVDSSHLPFSERIISELETYIANRGVNFTAVVAFNDYMAMAAVAVLTRRGLRIPHDVSVTGVDNLEPALTVPRLTTVEVPLSDMGHRAAEIVLEMVEGGKPARKKWRSKVETFLPKLFVRESTGPVKSTD